MSNPITLQVADVPLWRQVQAQLVADTDPAQGLLAALGNGANSVYPNFTTDGPNTDPALCARPFVVALSGGVRAINESGREFRVIIEVHDSPDEGDLRWPGIVARIKQVLFIEEFRPNNSTSARYVTGLQFESESPQLPDTRYDTIVTQIVGVVRGMDSTSNRGRQG